MTDLRGQNSRNQEKKTVKWVILFAVAVVLIVIAVAFFVRGRMGENSDATMNRTAAKTEEVKSGDADTGETESVQTEGQTDTQADGNTAEEPAQTAPGSADATEAVEVQSTEQTVDMSGDYLGEIACPQPPVSEGYRLYSTETKEELLMLYIENSDDANFSFYLTRAVLNDSETQYTEEVIFPEHIAHYNGNGYYEYYDEQYHLYFKYSVLGHTASHKRVDVFGLDAVYDPNAYDNVIEYDGMTGNQFAMGHPVVM